MKSKKLKLGHVSSILVLCVFLCTHTVGAVSKVALPADHLVTITPYLQTVTLPAADPEKTFSVSITNNSKIARNFKFSVIDFGSLNETGGLVFAGAKESTFMKKYGLQTWLKLSTDELTIEPNKTAEITARIVNDDSLAPGGHYAAVVASVSADKTQIGNSISLNQKLSSLILATKTGGEKYDLRLDTFTYKNSWHSLPQAATLKFKNDGNVHVIPRGTVELKNSAGKTVAKGVINEASSYVLPETKRDINVNLKPVGKSSNWPGNYRLIATYHYDGYDNYATRSLTLRYIPWLLIYLILLMLVILGFIYYMYTKSFIGRKLARIMQRILQRK